MSFLECVQYSPEVSVRIGVDGEWTAYGGASGGWVAQAFSLRRFVEQLCFDVQCSRCYCTGKFHPRIVIVWMESMWLLRLLRYATHDTVFFFVCFFNSGFDRTRSEKLPTKCFLPNPLQVCGHWYVYPVPICLHSLACVQQVNGYCLTIHTRCTRHGWMASAMP